MIATILRWRRDSNDLKAIVEARQISRTAALNALYLVMTRKKGAK